MLTDRRDEIEDTWALEMVNFGAEEELTRLRAAGLGLTQMNCLRTLINSQLGDDASIDDYMRAATRCTENISLLLFGGDDEGNLTHLVMTWPHEISELLVCRIEQREPVILVILAHYAVLMTLSPKFWWLAAWPHVLLDQIERILPTEMQYYLSWPRQMLGKREEKKYMDALSPA